MAGRGAGEAPATSDGARRLDALLAHPDRKDVEFVDKGRYSFFRYRGRRVSGLLSPLRRSLWPRYDYEVANSRATKRFSRRDPSLRRRSDGAERGTRVHVDIETFTNYGKEAIKKRGIDSYTLKFLLALHKWKLRPVVSELAVFDSTIGAATNADLLCLDRRNRVVLIETKTGYYASWDRACERMSGPLEDVLSDSPCSQALTQLMFTKRMVENYGTHVDSAFVVRVTPDGVYTEKLRAEIEERNDLAAAYVQQTRPTRRG